MRGRGGTERQELRLLIVNRHWNMDCLGVMVDMAGCPNRCRHCWLGAHKNGCMTVEAFDSHE